LIELDPYRSDEAPPEMFAKDGMFASKVAFYMLWFEFLAISPSYELARRFNAGEWTEADEQKRPADFDRVLEVYRDLGDVQRRLFRHWWVQKGFDAFGYQGAKPKVQKVFTIDRSKAAKPDISDRTTEYVERAWRKQGRQRTMVVAIPVGLPKQKVTRQVNKLLNEFPEEMRVLRNKAPKYPLAGKRQDKRSLFRYLLVVWARLKRPKERLWRVGVLTKISSMYSGRLDASENPGHGAKTDDRAALKFLTNRAIYRGRMIAENAARGIFPSYAKCPHAVPPDLDEQYRMFVARRRWQASVKKQATADATPDLER